MKEGVTISFDGAHIYNNGGTINGDILNPTYKFYGGMDREQLKQKVKGAIETLYKEGTLTAANQWYGIKRCLVDRHMAGQNVADFQAFVDSLDLDVGVKCDNEAFRKVPNINPRLLAHTDSWGSIQQPSDAENKQIIVAVRLLELLS